MLQRAEDLADSSFSGVSGYQDVLDVFRLWGRSLEWNGLLAMCRLHPVLIKPKGGSLSYRVVSRTQQAVTDLDLGGALDGLFEGACHLHALGAGGGRKTQSGQAVRKSGGRGAAAGRRKGTEISRLRDCRAVEQAGLRWAATEGRELQAVLLSDAAAAGGPAKMTMTMTMGRPVGIHGRPSTTKGAE